MREDWDTTELSGIAAVERGLSWKKEQESAGQGDGLVPVVRIGNVQPSGLDMSERLYLRGVDVDRSRRRIIKRGSILMVGSNGNADRIGNVCFADAAIAGHAYASFLIGIHPHDCGDSRFLYHLLRSPQTQHAITAATSGSTGLKNVSLTTIRQMELPWPQKDERQRITTVLDAAEAAHAAALVHLARAQTLLAVAIDSLLEASADWQVLPAGWDLSTLGALTDIRSGITKGRRTGDPVAARPFLRAANVQHGRLDLDEIHTFDATDTEVTRFALQPDDVLLIEGGSAPDVGRGWIWDGQIEGCIHQNHVFRARITDARLTPRFLAYAVCATPARAYCLSRSRQSSNLASINKTQISALPVPLPPPDEQQVIVDRLDAIKATCDCAADASTRLDDLYQALASRLFSDGLLDRAVAHGAHELVGVA